MYRKNDVTHTVFELSGEKKKKKSNEGVKIYRIPFCTRVNSGVVVVVFGSVCTGEGADEWVWVYDDDDDDDDNDDDG